MTGLQLALASGTLLGMAVALLVWRVAPSDPDLVDALDRLSPDHVVPRHGAGASGAEDTESGSLVDRVGVWALKNLPGGAWHARHAETSPSCRSARPGSMGRRSSGHCSAW